MSQNKITVNRVSVVASRIEVYYTIEGEIERYFNPAEKCFWAEYTEDVSSVPASIAVLPFVCNVLPIAWLTDAELVVDDLDEEFYHSISEVKHGYMLLSRMLEFKGKVTARRLVRNVYEPTHESAVLFSGGVDAFTTLFRHLDEQPVMITLRGSDVKLTDVEGWKVVSDHVESTAKTFGLPRPEFVTTNFRTFINEGELGGVCAKSGDGWWHGYQHGIGIISHAAPIAYVKKIRTVCIASSATWESLCIYASDPVIDSHLKFASSHVYHDGYYMGRSQKVKYLVDGCKERNVQIHLRVCWITEGGHNCCQCEKCIRTIYNILAAGGNPRDFGFKITKEQEKNIRKVVVASLNYLNHRVDWHGIQDYILEHGTFAEKDNPDYNWIYTIDIDKAYPKPSLIRRCAGKLKRIARRIVT